MNIKEYRKETIIMTTAEIAFCAQCIEKLRKSERALFKGKSLGTHIGVLQKKSARLKQIANFLKTVQVISDEHKNWYPQKIKSTNGLRNRKVRSV